MSSNLYNVLSGLTDNQYAIASSLANFKIAITSVSSTVNVLDDLVITPGEAQTGDLKFLSNRGTYEAVLSQDVLNNYAKLIDGKVPASSLPSYVDDVVEGYLINGDFYENSDQTNIIAKESGKIYVDLTDSKNEIYRCTGSAGTYIKISGNNGEALVELNQKISDVSGNLNTATANISTVSGNADTLIGNVSYLSTTIDGVTTRIDGVDDDIEFISGKVDEALAMTPSAGAVVDYLLFKIPNFNSNTSQFKIVIWLSETDNFASTAIIDSSESNMKKYFSIGYNGSFIEVPANDITSVYENDVLRFNIALYKEEHQNAQDMNRIKWQWVDYTTSTSGIIGFGMANGAIQVTDEKFAIDELSLSAVSLRADLTALQTKHIREVDSLSGEVQFLSGAIQEASGSDPTFTAISGRLSGMYDHYNSTSATFPNTINAITLNGTAAPINNKTAALSVGWGTLTGSISSQSDLSNALSAKQDKITSSNKLSYSLLSSTPTIPTVNNSTISFTQGGVSKGSFTLNQTTGSTIELDIGLETVSWNDITDAPTIPTVNNPTITLQQGGVTKGTFTLNQSGASTINFDAGGAASGAVINGTNTAVDEAEAGQVLIYSNATSGNFIQGHIYKCGAGGGYTVDTDYNQNLIGTFTPNGATVNGVPVYSKTSGNDTYYFWVLKYEIPGMDEERYAWMFTNSTGVPSDTVLEGDPWNQTGCIAFMYANSPSVSPVGATDWWDNTNTGGQLDTGYYLNVTSAGSSGVTFQDITPAKDMDKVIDVDSSTTALTIETNHNYRWTPSSNSTVSLPSNIISTDFGTCNMLINMTNASVTFNNITLVDTPESGKVNRVEIEWWGTSARLYVIDSYTA